MFDEKWMKEGGKPIESVADVGLILCACDNFGCKKCARNMYRPKGVELGGTEACQGVKAEAAKFLGELLGRDVKVEQVELVFALAEAMALEKPKQPGLPCKVIDTPLEERCSTCTRSKMHPSGIRYCESFGNFVHEDGFCYRYEDGKMEVEAD